MNWFSHAWHWVSSRSGWYWITHTGVTLLAVLTTWALTTYSTHRGRRAALNDELRPAIVQVLSTGYALRTSLEAASRAAHQGPHAGRAFLRGTPEARDLEALTHESANAVVAARLLCRDPALRSSLERYWVQLANRRMGQDAMSHLVYLWAFDTRYDTPPDPIPAGQEARWETVAEIRAARMDPEQITRNAYQYLDNLTDILLRIESDAHRYFTAWPITRYWSALTTHLRTYRNARKNNKHQGERRRDITRNAAAAPAQEPPSQQPAASPGSSTPTDT